MDLKGNDAREVAAAMTSRMKSNQSNPENAPRTPRIPRLGDVSREAGGPIIASEHTSTIPVHQTVRRPNRLAVPVPDELKIEVTWIKVFENAEIVRYLASGSTVMIEVLKTWDPAYIEVNHDGKTINVMAEVFDPLASPIAFAYAESYDDARSWAYRYMLGERWES